MKTLKLVPFIMGCGLCLVLSAAKAQSFKTHISREFSVKQPSTGELAIYNIFGSIKVEGTTGDKVTMEIDETISGDSPSDVEQGKKEFKMGFDQKGDSVAAYIAAPYDSRPHKNWYQNDDRHIDYTVKLEFVVKVPNNLNLHVSTVNDGDLDIANVYGKLKVNNVNGPITIKNAKSTSDISTVNGGITVNYLSVPTEACNYYTVNGKLHITYPAGLAADLQFKSMNGSFYTDFENVEALPNSVTKTEDKKANGTVYKLNKNTRVKVGAGGKLFKFETLNGDIYIKKQS